MPLSLATKLPGGTRSRAPMRVVPDVSADANSSTGLVIGLGILRRGKYRFATIPVGGTSLACPTMAAIEADAQQAAGGPLGFADPAIYARYRTPAFRDVTDHPLGMAHPSVVVSAGGQGTFLEALNIDGEGRGALRAVRGYDDATGVGHPTGTSSRSCGDRPAGSAGEAGGQTYSAQSLLHNGTHRLRGFSCAGCPRRRVCSGCACYPGHSGQAP